MNVSAATLVRRWGGRAVALTVTGIGLYVVAPSLLTLFGAWPRLRDVQPWWFVVLVALEACSMAALWWLTRIALAPAQQSAAAAHPPPLGWGTVATAQLAGNAASKVVPGGPAAGGVVQARLLVRAGQSPAVVASALTAVGLLTTGVLLLLPVLTVPALIIGPPPARQLQLGLLVSVVLAVLIVGLGVTALTWRGVLERVGRAVGYAIHVVRRSVSAQSVAASLVAQRDRVARAFEGRWWRAVFASAANRMFDYAALVAALVALGARARPAEVLLAYVVAQALALIPITPGGLGFVESGLTTLLVLIGISADTALIATLLYRLVSFWLPIPVGASAWAGWHLHRTARQGPRGAAGV
ncbi:MAG TPA: lysylphosphatidylglycerol synthase transmembrane domain-containing protein [Nocardioides sp.]|nr:lysylphosphatidylglycerol synthase transmembrane domain-containing protein [Nocardioides sp.]